MTAAPAALPADLEAGLKRLKLATVRRMAPEVLQTATTQRWKPDEILRTFVEAEIAARDEANRRGRHRQAGFPVAKTFDGFDVAASSVPPATVDYLAGLEWVRAPENLCLVGPAGTGKSHLLIAAGHAAVEAGHRVRYLSAAELVETLYRGQADNSVGRIIDQLLRNDVVLVDEVGFAPSTPPAPSCCFASSPPPTNAEPSGSPHTGRSTTGAGSCPSTPPPPHYSTGSCTTPWSSSPTATPTACAPEEVAPQPNPTRPDGEFQALLLFPWV